MKYFLLLTLLVTLNACSWNQSAAPEADTNEAPEEVSRVSEESSDPYDPQFLENGLEELELIDQ